MKATKDSFNDLRRHCPLKPLLAHRVADESEVLQMHTKDGLEFWRDGTAGGAEPDSLLNAPLLKHNDLASRKLWVVREDDVPVALERCAFGRSLKLKVIKHSNLLIRLR